MLLELLVHLLSIHFIFSQIVIKDIVKQSYLIMWMWIIEFFNPSARYFPWDAKETNTYDLTLYIKHQKLPRQNFAIISHRYTILPKVRNFIKKKTKDQHLQNLLLLDPHIHNVVENYSLHKRIRRNKGKTLAHV